MDKAITQARHDYLEEIERLTEIYNQAVAKAQKEYDDAKARAWEIRQERIVKAGS